MASGSLPYLLTQADSRTRIEREEHERIGDEQGLSVIDEAIWIKLFRFICAHRGRWVEGINTNYKVGQDLTHLLDPRGLSFVASGMLSISIWSLQG